MKGTIKAYNADDNTLTIRLELIPNEINLNKDVEINQ